jgi:ABC-2 type transport system permease protein
VSVVEPTGSFSDPVWPAVWKLLRLQLSLTISGFRRTKLIRKIVTVIFILVIIGVLIGAFVLAWKVIGVVRSPEFAAVVGDPTPFLDTIPILVVASAFLGILLTSFGVLLQALYLAGDMDFLLSAPIPIRAVFITKLLQAILPNFTLILAFGLPVLYGLGAARHYHILYYPFVLIVLAALALAAAGLSSLLVMAIARVIPARRVAEVLAFLGAIFSVLCSQMGQFSNRFENIDYSALAQTQLNSRLSLLNSLNTPWSPLNWAGRGLVDLGEGRWLSALFFLALTLGVCAIAFAVSLRTAERLYYSGWASMQVGTQRKRIARSTRLTTVRKHPFATLIEGTIPAPVRAVISKDFLMLRRDLRSMSQVVTPIIFGIIYAFLLLGSGGEPPEGRGEAPPAVMEAMRTMMSFGSVGISLFVSWSLISRLAMMGFSHEGRNYWMLKAAPLKNTQLLFSKFLVAYLPSLALGWAFLLIVSIVQRVSIQVLLYGLPVVALCIAGLAGINLAFGVTGVKLDWTDPRRINSGSAGCLSSLASLTYLGVTLSLFFGPSILTDLLGLPQWIGLLAGLLLGGSLGLTCTFLPPWLVRKRVDSIGEA